VNATRQAREKMADAQIVALVETGQEAIDSMLVQ
jgi:hypothetical protein